MGRRRYIRPWSVVLVKTCTDDSRKYYIFFVVQPSVINNY